MLRDLTHFAARQRKPALTVLVLVAGIAAALLLLGRRAQALPDGPATPDFRGKNSPLPEPGSD